MVLRIKIQISNHYIMRRISLILIISHLFYLTTFSQILKPESFSSKNLISRLDHNSTLVFRLDWNSLTKEERASVQAGGARMLTLYRDGTALLGVPDDNSSLLDYLSGMEAYEPQPGFNLAPDLGNGQSGNCIVSTIKPYGKSDFKELMLLGLEVVDEMNHDPLRFSVGKNDVTISLLSARPDVVFIENEITEFIPLSDKTSAMHGVAPGLHGMDGLTGEGVVIGVGDGGSLGNHIDFNGRTHDEAAAHITVYGAHPDVVSGIIAGRGNINGQFQGVAPHSEIVLDKVTEIITDLPEHYQNYGLTLTNNSYGTSFTCESQGAYQYNSAYLDNLALQYDDVLHVFASGNNGTQTCGSYPEGYATLVKAYNVSKNVLTVGAANVRGDRMQLSSAGPAQDGRIKPEIISLGQNVYGANRDYGYGYLSGTSGATASATGTLALLSERYKQLHNGQNPKAALLKALVCNTARDKGAAGPDFLTGFGLMDAGAALNVLENGDFLLDNLNHQSEIKEYTIEVLPGTKEARFMLYWHDNESFSGSVSSLVNDLDITVIAPDGTEFLPWVLNPSVSNVSDLALRGMDHVNNIEQVTIADPQAGTYTIRVSSTVLVEDGLEFVFTHDIRQPEFSMIYPYEGVSLCPGEEIFISWNWNKTNTSKFMLEYATSPNGPWEYIGNTGTNIRRALEWEIPVLNEGELYVKVTSTTTGESIVSSPFSVRPVPGAASVETICAEYVDFQWQPVEGVSSYEIYMMGEQEMELVGVTDQTVYGTRLEGENEWFSVKAVFPDGSRSRRTEAVLAQSSQVFPCPWENDIRLVDLEVGPTKGRQFTSTQLSGSTPLTVKVLNAGNNPINTFTINITTDNVEYFEEVNQVILPGEELEYQTLQTFDFSTAGLHDVSVFTDLENDIHDEEEYDATQLFQIPNPSISLPFEFSMGVIPELQLWESTMGVPGAEYSDFYTTGSGNMQKIQGAPAIYLNNNDKTLFSEWSLTLNLEGTEILTPALRYQYSLSNSTELDGMARIYFRGKDDYDWILLGQLLPAQAGAQSEDYNLKTIAEGNGQSLHSSAQIKFVVEGNMSLGIENVELFSLGGTLPVELSYFKAIKKDGDVLLEWETLSEKDNDYFEIQVAGGEEALRAEAFETIGFVSGNGNSAQRIIYDFLDDKTEKVGTLYYRLLQVDYDGTVSYSDIVSVKFEEGQGEWSVFPNPLKFGENPNVRFESLEEGNMEIILRDVSGRKLKHTVWGIEKGGNTSVFEMPPGLSSGIYYLSGNMGLNSFTTKVVVR